MPLPNSGPLKKPPAQNKNNPNVIRVRLNQYGKPIDKINVPEGYRAVEIGKYRDRKEVTQQAQKALLPPTPEEWDYKKPPVGENGRPLGMNGEPLPEGAQAFDPYGRVYWGPGLSNYLKGVAYRMTEPVPAKPAKVNDPSVRRGTYGQVAAPSEATEERKPGVFDYAIRGTKEVVMGVLSAFGEPSMKFEQYWGAVAMTAQELGGGVKEYGDWRDWFLQAAPVVTAYNMLKITAKGTDPELFKETWDRNLNAAHIAYSAYADPAIRKEYLRRYEELEDPHLLAMELENPKAEFWGQIVNDPLNIIDVVTLGAAKTARSAGVVAKMRNIADPNVAKAYGAIKAAGAASDGRAAELITDLVQSHMTAISKQAKGLESAATGIKGYSPLARTALGKRSAVSRQIGELVGWVLTTVDNDPDAAVDVLIAMARAASDNADEAALGLNHMVFNFPAPKPLLSDAGNNASIVIRQALLDETGKLNPSKWLDELQEASMNVDDLVKFVDSKMTPIVDGIFPDINKMTDAQLARVPKYAQALNKFNNTAQKVYGPLNRMFSNMYMGMSPGYVFRNALQNTVQAFIDTGIKGGAQVGVASVESFFKPGATANRWRSTVQRWLGGSVPSGFEWGFGGGPAAAADVAGKTDKAGGGIGAWLKHITGVGLRKSEAVESGASASIVGKSVQDTMRKALRPGKAIPDVAPLIAAGMSEPEARILQNLVIDNYGDVKKATKLFKEAANEGNIDVVRIISNWVDQKDLDAMASFGMLDEIRDAIANSENFEEANRAVGSILDNLIKEGEKAAEEAQGISRVADEIPSASAMGKAAAEGHLSDEVLDLSNRQMNANGAANRSIVRSVRQVGMEEATKAMKAGDPEKAAAVGTLWESFIVHLDEFEDANRLEDAEFVKATWDLSDKIKALKNPTADDMIKLWKDSVLVIARGDPPPGITNKRSFTDYLWDGFFRPNRMDYWRGKREQYAEVAQTFFEELSKITGVDYYPHPTLEKARDALKNARDWDKPIDLGHGLWGATAHGPAWDVARELGLEQEFMKAGPLGGEKHLLNTINKYLPEGPPGSPAPAKFTRLDEVPEDIARAALEKRVSLPKTVYHATTRKFDGLPDNVPGMLGEKRRMLYEPDGIYFNASQDEAVRGAGLVGKKNRVVEANVNAKNVYVVNKNNVDEFHELYNQAARDIGWNEKDMAIEDWLAANYGADEKVATRFTEILESKGYDAVYKVESGDFIAFKKSAVAPAPLTASSTATVPGETAEDAGKFRAAVNKLKNNQDLTDDEADLFEDILARNATGDERKALRVIEEETRNLENSITQWGDAEKKLLSDLKEDWEKQVDEIANRIEKAAGEQPTKVASRQTFARGAIDKSVKYEFDVEVVDLDDLIPSHLDSMAENPNFPQELQPRVRGTSQASREQVEKIASQLVPDDLLYDTHRIDTGSMIVGPKDNIVEAGNGRVMGLRKARDTYPDRWREYQDALRAALPEYGMSEKDIEGIKNPVLIRRRKTEVDRLEFVRDAGTPVTMEFSAFERAMMDSKSVPDERVAYLILDEDQTVEQALRNNKNQELVDAWFEGLPETQRGAMIDEDGNLSELGLTRLTNAILAKTFPGDAGNRMLKVFIEVTDPGIKNIESAVYAALPDMSKLESAVRLGVIPKDYALAEDLSVAIDAVYRIKNNFNMTVGEYVSQAGMFGGREIELTPFQIELALFLEKNNRSQSVVRNTLRKYSTGVFDGFVPKQIDLFDAKIPERVSGTREEIFKWAVGKSTKAEKDAARQAVDEIANRIEKAAKKTGAADDAAEKAGHRIIYSEPDPDAMPTVPRMVREQQAGLKKLKKRLQDGLKNNWGKTEPILKNEELDKALGDWGAVCAERVAEARLTATSVANATRDFALLNYQDKRYIDLALAYIYPYQYWYSRTYANWMGRLVSDPAVVAGYAKYKQALEKIHAGQPDWWKYNINTNELFGLDSDNPIFGSLEAALNPMNGLTGIDFDDPERRVGWFTETLDNLNKFGPSTWTPISIITAVALKMKGEEAAAQRWGARLIPQTASLKSLTALMNIGPPGGLELDPLTNYFSGGLDPYERKRVGRALYTLVQNGAITEAEAEDAAREQSGEVWDMAKDYSAKARAKGQLSSFVLGVGFKLRSQSDMEIDQYYQQQRYLWAMEPNLSPDEFRDAMDQLKLRYPFMDAVLLSRKGGPERDRSYAYSVLGRIGPGAKTDIAKAVGIDPRLIGMFYEDKGHIETWAKSDRERFMAGVVELGALLDIPGQATRAEWNAASKEYRAMMDVAKGRFGDDIEARTDIYYSAKGDTQASRDKANAILEADPEIASFLDWKTTYIFSNELLSTYYGGLNNVKSYYDGMFYGMVEKELGDDIFDKEQEYYILKDSGGDYKAYKKEHPELTRLWDMRDHHKKVIADVLARTGSHIKEGLPMTLRPDADASSLAAQDVIQALNKPAGPVMTWDQWKKILPDELSQVLYGSFRRGVDFPGSAYILLDEISKQLGWDTETLVNQLLMSMDKY